MDQYRVNRTHVTASSDQRHRQHDSPPGQTSPAKLRQEGGLHPADLDYLLAFFPEVAERILKAARVAPADKPEPCPQ